MIDREHIGQALRRKTRMVELGQLRFFMNVIGDQAAYDETGPLRIPPTYLFCLEMMDDPDPLDWLKGLGVDLLYILHGQQRFDYHAPAFAGDTLTFMASIEDIHDKKNGAMQFIVKKTEVRNQADVHIATLSSTVIYRDPSHRKS